MTMENAGIPAQVVQSSAHALSTEWLMSLDKVAVLPIIAFQGAALQCLQTGTLMPHGTSFDFVRAVGIVLHVVGPIAAGYQTVARVLGVGDLFGNHPVSAGGKDQEGKPHIVDPCPRVEHIAVHTERVGAVLVVLRIIGGNQERCREPSCGQVGDGAGDAYHVVGKGAFPPDLLHHLADLMPFGNQVGVPYLPPPTFRIRQVLFRYSALE